MASLKLQNVAKAFGNVKVIHDVNLAVETGEFVVLVGPSGCGKSTLLRMISGLESTTSGKILIDNVDVTDVDPADRGAAMVFQSYALYPHMTVGQNIGFGLKMSGVPKAEVAAQVDEAARILELNELLDRKPKALSGGQRQRVAIGRAIVRDPKIFLFDEPLSNLDAELRVQMRLEIAKLHQRLNATMIYVTHDQVEAMTLADRIVVLRSGRVEQVGSPIELYDDPANQFVAGFIGSPRMNFLDGEVISVTGQTATIALSGFAGAQVSVPLRNGTASAGQKVTLGARPEHFIPAEQAGATIKAQVQVVEQLGGVSYLYLGTDTGGSVTVQQQGHSRITSGQTITVGLDPASCLLFDAQGQRL